MIYSSIANLQAAASNLNNGIDVLKKELKEGQYSLSSFFLAKTLSGSIPSLLLVSIVCNIIHFLANLNKTSPTRIIQFNFLVIVGSLCSESLGILLSSIFPAEGSTKAVIPFIIFSLCLFAGLLISIDQIPNVLMLFNYGSFFKYYYEGLIMNEFDRLNGCREGICEVPRKEMSFTKLPKQSFLIMIGIVILARAIGQLAFYLRLKKYYFDAEVERKIRKKYLKQERLSKKKVQLMKRQTMGVAKEAYQPSNNSARTNYLSWIDSDNRDLSNAR